MKNMPVFLLIDSEVEKLLVEHCLMKIGLWCQSWGFLTDKIWSVSVDRDFSSVGTSKEIDKKSFNFNGAAIFVDPLQSEMNISSHVMHKKKLIARSDLLTYVVGSCMAGLESTFLDGFFEKNEISLSSKSNSEGFYEDKKINFLKVRMSCENIQFDIFLSPVLLEKILLSYIAKKKMKKGCLEAIKNCFPDESVSLSASYGDAVLKVGEVLSIKVGDVIRLDKKIGEPICLFGASGEKLLEGKLGVDGNNIAVKIEMQKKGGLDVRE
jgi:hypothetical protein